MSDPRLHWLAQIEPSAAGADPRHSAGDIAAVSAAISLKRIADWLEGNGPNYLADQLTHAISAGMHHGFASRNR